MDTRLRQYIACVRNLEIQKETLAKTITNIDRKINTLGIPRRINRERNPIELNFWEMYSLPLLLIAPIVIIGLVFLFVGFDEFSTVYYTASGTEHGNGSTLCWYGFAMLLAGGLLLALIISRYKKQEKRCIENEQIINRNYRINKQNDEKRVSNELILKQKYQQARNTLYNTYAQTCSTLNALYAKNIIYSKYQNDLVAICMFHEYFESGRCNALTGHEGAYNIYEQELRMGIIIGKLDIIIEKLDEIQSNQYALYTAVKQISNQQARILNSLQQITYNQNMQSESLEHIRYNTAALKQNSDIAMIYALF